MGVGPRYRSGVYGFNSTYNSACRGSAPLGFPSCRRPFYPGPVATRQTDPQDVGDLEDGVYGDVDAGRVRAPHWSA